jgi:hypothetical protein
MSTSAFAGVDFDCEEGAVEGLQNCNVSGFADQSCANSAQDLSAISKILDHAGTTSVCTDDDLKFTQKKSYAEIKQFRHELKKECRQKAKEYKHAVLQDLMQKNKFGQALKVLFKKKKFKTKNISNEASEDAIAVDLKELEGKSTAELNQYVMKELEKLHPGLTKKAEDLQKNNPSFKYGFHENESVPINVMIKTDNNKTCSAKLQDLPQREPFKAKDCSFCEVKDIRNSFVNDCSYMVSKDYPESKVDGLLGVKDANRKDFCQKDMKKGNDTDMSDINKMSDEICNIARSGMTPDFKIQTSRNLYQDYTPQLAAKRGDFVQKYIRDKLMNECDLTTLPSWLSSEDEFKQRVKLSHPFYDGAKEGDYGPNPNATVAEQADEIKKYKNTLVHEQKGLSAEIIQLQMQKTNLNKDIEKINAEIKTLSASYTSAQKKIGKETDFEVIKQTFDSVNPKSATSIANKIEDLIDLANTKTQRLSDIDSEIRGNEKRMLQYSDSAMNEKTEKLKKFYAEKDTPAASQPGFREKWDQSLFNDFKMVKITGKALAQDSMLATNTEIDPKLDVMLNLVSDADEFACIVQPLHTNQLKAGAYLKGSGQVVMGSIALVGGIAAGAGVVVAGVFNSFLSLFCVGCGKAGKQIPTWRKVGNIFEIGPKGVRKRFWKDLKGDVKDLITLKGRLEIKNSSSVKRTDYQDYDRYAEQYYGDDYQSKTNSSEKLEVKEIRDAKGVLTGMETYDSKGVLIEEKTMDKTGKVIEVIRYNKDGTVLENQ